MSRKEQAVTHRFKSPISLASIFNVIKKAVLLIMKINYPIMTPLHLDKLLLGCYGNYLLSNGVEISLAIKMIVIIFIETLRK